MRYFSHSVLIFNEDFAMRFKAQAAALLVGAALCVSAAAAHAASIAPGFNTSVLGANDDGSAGPADLGF